MQGTGYGYPPAVDPLFGYFSAVAGRDGQISPEELQRCLQGAGYGNGWETFSLETCRLMIGMLDRDGNFQMGFEEFKELWNSLNQWKHTYYTVDRDRSGTVNEQELHQAIRTYGYNLSPEAFRVVFKRYARREQTIITFDDFIAVSVRLRCLSENFRRRDTHQNGTAMLSYDEFIRFSFVV
ncbi:sorcin, variant [Capsaspora owczarzaki ATCC 30864]|uniref:sorcin, variant n=1 Tax=Capsaspora owczarzaki (strain ATCC 30864) TaxID=595528 RepID=UPI0003520DE6|nr:sorcin, variant [Capsaspora owczarzaki ATCC 30864]|eukprot:XP_011270782.1 sorcin, variant [Capsaspora owczarzaki ATCC 30864]